MVKQKENTITWMRKKVKKWSTRDFHSCNLNVKNSLTEWKELNLRQTRVMRCSCRMWNLKNSHNFELSEGRHLYCSVILPYSAVWRLSYFCQEYIRYRITVNLKGLKMLNTVNCVLWTSTPQKSGLARDWGSSPGLTNISFLSPNIFLPEITADQKIPVPRTRLTWSFPFFPTFARRQLTKKWSYAFPWNTVVCLHTHSSWSPH